MPRGIAGSKADSVWVATETFACEVDGVGVIVHAGETRVREGHPMLNTYRQSFKLADQGIHFDTVEQATAAPGEKRGTPPAPEPQRHVEPESKPAEPIKTTDRPAKVDGRRRVKIDE